MTKTMTTPGTNTNEKTILYKDLINQVFIESESLSHGIVTLEIHVRDSRPVRAVVSRSQSILLEGGAKC